MAKQTTIKLTSNVERNEIFAVCTSLNVFQFCTVIDNLFAIDLQSKKPVELLINEKTVTPSSYSAKCQTNPMTVTVLENKVDGEWLVDFLKNISFFVKISSFVTDSQIADFQAKLNSCKDFQFVQKIDFSKLNKSQTNLLKMLIKHL